MFKEWIYSSTYADHGMISRYSQEVCSGTEIDSLQIWQKNSRVTFATQKKDGEWEVGMLSKDVLEEKTFPGTD